MRLSPVYDLVSTTIVLPQDTEESALTLNGKKARLEKDDFETLAASLEIPQAVSRKIFAKFQGLQGKMDEVVRGSWLSGEMQERLAKIIEQRMGELGD
jgi:serine/threonine-protein kinase HipA